MQPVGRSAPAPPRPGHLWTTCNSRATATSRGSLGAAARRVAVTPPPRLRARATCVGAGGSGTTEPAVPVAQLKPSVIAEPQEEAEAVAQELEVLAEAAIAGEDEGRRPTDYDRRAHIFEESSRVFRELKQRRDGDGVQGSGDGAAAETTATLQPHQLG